MKTIQLQGIGHVEAVEAATIKVGDVRMYNQGHTSTIIKVIDKSAKTLTIITADQTRDGVKYYMSDIRKTSLVAIVKHGQDISMHNPKEAYNVSGRNKGMVDVSEYFQTEQTEEEKTEAYHIELQGRGIALTESKPVINLDSTYKVIVSKDRKQNLIGEFETVLSGKELEFQVFMNEVLEIIEELPITESNGIHSLKTELNEIDNQLNKGVEVESINDSKVRSGELRVKISNSIEQLFKIEGITEAQNARINMLLNEWNGSGNYEFISLYTEGESIVLHVTYDNNSNLYLWFDKYGVRTYSNSYVVLRDNLVLIHDFNNSSVSASSDVTVNENITKKPSDHSIILNHDKERNSIQLTFDGIPAEEVRNAMKSKGFRYAFKTKTWYKKNATKEHVSFVYTLGNVTEETYNSNVSDELETYPEIEITDITGYTIPQDLQDRENDNNWITRAVERDHNKEVQGVFETYQNEVLGLLETTNNIKVKYELKRSLEYFKKHYHETYLKYITAKANNPSWITTGRGGMDVSRYNKKMAQQDKHMLHLSELIDEMKKRIQKAKNQIKKDEKQAITAAVESCGLDIEFKMRTREFTYMGITEKRKVHTYGDYWIAKTWGTFRIFYKDQEIHSCKTTEKLEHAKKFVAYHIKKESKKAV